MPNWCGNTLTVTGPRAELHRFFRENRSKEKERGALSFDRGVPMPDRFKGSTSPSRRPDESLQASMARARLEWAGKLPASDWHSWRLCHWGTKWDLDEETDFHRIPGGLVYSFSTAWSPPTEWVEEISSKYPELQFRLEYGEMGNDFAGVVVVQNNRKLEERDGHYHDFYKVEPEEEI